MEKDELSFEQLYQNSLKEDTKLEKTVTGTIIQITQKGEIFVDLGYKADGIIPRSEYSFRETDDPKKEWKVGDTITADVLKLNDGYGNVLLSYKRAKERNAKQDFEQKVKQEAIFEGMVSEVSDKGLIVNNNGIRIFIPLSLSGIKKEENKEEYQGKTVRFKIVEYEPKTRRVIGSIRAVQEEEKEQWLKEFWDGVEIGKVYDGVVNSISNYGAFIEVGPVQGLLHISDMSWSKNTSPNEILQVGQTIKVKIKNADKANRRLLLEYEDKGPNPWEKTTYEVGDMVTVSVVKLMPFGAFVQLEPGIEGLVHISQICEKRIAKPEEVLEVGKKVNAKIIAIEKESQKMELSMKELEGTSNELKED